MNIGQLNKAGFSGDEIQSYMAGKRTKLIDAGFSGKEIDEHLGIPPLDDPVLKQEVQSIITLPDPDGTKLEQGEEPSLWEKFFRVFEPSWGKRVAKSQISLEFAKETGLPPHVFEPTLGEAVKGGFEGSVTGLMMTGRLPQVPSHEYLSGNTRIAAQAATLAGDFPWMIAGAVLGAEGGPPTAVGGAFALPAGLRKVLMDKYEKGDIQSFSEFWSRLSGAVWETLKGEATGVATGKVGMMIPGMGKLPAEIVTMVTVGDALEGQIPEPQEFIDAAIVIGGMHASVHIAGKLRTIYRDTGKRPSEIVEDIKAEPSIEEDILSDNRDVPEFYDKLKEPELKPEPKVEIERWERTQEDIIKDNPYLYPSPEEFSLEGIKAIREHVGEKPAKIAEAERNKRIQDIIDTHRTDVELALSEGKPVPEAVLKDYPELKAKPEVEAETFEKDIAKRKAEEDASRQRIADIKEREEVFRKHFGYHPGEVIDLELNYQIEAWIAGDRNAPPQVSGLATGKPISQKAAENFPTATHKKKAQEIADESHAPVVLGVALDKADIPTGAFYVQMPKNFRPDMPLDRVMLDEMLPRTTTSIVYPKADPAFAAEKGFRREVKAEDQIPAKPVKRSDIVKFLTEKLDVPIRTGRFWGGKSKFLGIFKLKPEVIRTRFANDIEVITHEVGHGLQKYLWPETVTEKGLSNRPFTAFKDELEPLATKPKAGQEILPEGFAEFVRLYVTDAKEAKAKASKFYDYFEKTLDAKSPESREILIEVRRMYDRWIKQPSLMRVLSQISIGEKARKVTSFTDLYTMAIDDLHPMAEMVREMRGEKWWRFGRWGKGEEIDISKDPYKLARLMRGWHGKAEHFFEYSPFKFKTYENIGKPLKDILTPLKGSLDEFRAYIASKRAIELDQRGIETGILRKDAEKVVTDFGSKFEKVFRELKEYQDATLQYLADSGLLGADTLKQMREANRDYVPFYRVMEEARVPGTGRGLEARQPVKKIKGSWRDIHDPLESIIKNTYLYINLAEKNAVGRALIELAESKEGMGKYVEKIPTPMQVIKVQKTDLKAIIEEFGIDLPEGAVEIFRPSAFIPKENVISIWRNGKRELYEVHPEIARTMQALDRESMNLLMRILSKPAQWLRAGAVLTPEFMARNPIRDQFSAFCYTKYGFVPGFDMMRGIFSMAKKDQLYREWKKGGGAHSMLVSLDRQYLQKNLQELMRHPVRNMVKNPIELLRMLTEFSEAGTRIGEFKRARKKGAGIEEAAFASREVTLDFAKKGSIGKIVNNLVAFWSANLLGTDKMIRSFKERPGPTTIRVAASITLPSILLVLHNRQDERWKEIPQWQKDLFWIVMTEDHIWRIPKPFEMGILFGSTAERITEFILDNDPAAFDGILKSLGRGASPGVFPTIMVPVIEDIANRSLFLDRPIVPANREDMLPEYQYKPYTTEAAKAMGKLLGKLPPLKESRHISPAIMENYIRGWSGGLGMHVLKVADLALRKAGALPDPVKPAPSLADIPVIKAFVVRHPSASAESIHKFYDQYFKAQQIIQTAKALANKEFKTEEAIELLESAEVKLDSVYKALRNAHKTIDFIYQNQEMSPDEKRQLIDVTYNQMIAIAQEGNKLLKALKKAGKQ